MDLGLILNRFAEGIKEVDKTTTHISANRRTGVVYLPGMKTLTERKFVEELVNWWKVAYPSDFNPKNAIQAEVPYPNIPRAKCDLVLSSDGSLLSSPDWAIEVKHIALVGNNGKNNDFGVAKILSPYLKDRSLIHDIERMKNSGMGRRKAVIAYSFEYDKQTCAESLTRHPQHRDIVDNIAEVCRLNDPVNGEYPLLPMAEFADEIFQSKKLVHQLQVQDFSGVWRHPAGGNGKVFGWELQ